MFLKILIVAIFVAVTVAVGIFARKHSNSVDGFVPVSYTHLDVYKRQAKCCAVCS